MLVALFHKALLARINAAQHWRRVTLSRLEEAVLTNMPVYFPFTHTISISDCIIGLSQYLHTTFRGSFSTTTNLVATCSWLVMHEGLEHLMTFSMASGTLTRPFPFTSKCLMMLTVASGAKTDILLTSSSVKNRFSIFISAFLPIFFEERLVAIDTRLGWLESFSISATLNTVSSVRWSMTVPSSIFDTRCSLSNNGFPEGISALMTVRTSFLRFGAPFLAAFFTVFGLAAFFFAAFAFLPFCFFFAMLCPAQKYCQQCLPHRNPIRCLLKVKRVLC